MKDLRPLFRQIALSKSRAGSSVDFSIILEMGEKSQDGFEMMLEKLVTEFLENTPYKISEIRQSALSADVRLQGQIFSLKESCASLGAQNMMKLLDHLLGPSSLSNESLLVIEELEAEFLQVHDELLPYSSWYSLVKSDGWG